MCLEKTCRIDFAYYDDDVNCFQNVDLLFFFILFSKLESIAIRIEYPPLLIVLWVAEYPYGQPTAPIRTKPCTDCLTDRGVGAPASAQGTRTPDGAEPINGG